MLEKVQWDPMERIEVTQEMHEFFLKHIGEYAGQISRPDVKTFASTLKRVSGCPGLDGWSTFEASSIAGNQYLCAAAWEEMIFGKNVDVLRPHYGTFCCSLCRRLGATLTKDMGSLATSGR